MANSIKIGTHDGCFHCDECLACFMLKLLPRYKDATIVRTRNEAILNTCDIVVDVGGKFDPSTYRFDHHMRDFKETIDTVLKRPEGNSKIKLSSAGLVYCFFGKEIIKQILSELEDETAIDCIFNMVYETLIKEIDGVDNGIPMYSGEPAYRIVTGLSSRVDRLNPKWNSKDVNIEHQFNEAVALTGKEFIQHVEYMGNVWWPARFIVKDAISKRFAVDPSGEIIELSQGAPWNQHFYMLEKELGAENQILYVIFPDANDYRVRGVPVEKDSFVCRMFLPEKWGGLREEELSKVAGIEGCIFTHAIRFIGGHRTREGALAMARKAIEIGKSLK
ncbi:UPF0160 protein MYG1, mitochondrial isoform X2 [Orussus abietinus]|nr:UPF0160 protein MYG1, mitochondrial isoform X2 [Orussus abietinus]XP_012288754.1 UPF0160 protein MYG1, mitochondrial isoform X2 [Orussus abietinus]XP_012288755.1 UPF0160 protein MYG1, mitochondrial isoform X2 [Orussus abietinus]XP_012288756.1 UPF0160 protein MYG1, mitochondrial isoform X2 [Orussus abietinus]XP_012288757.1 UPF0160 protein MYG1, mitochondrial isoform X2 [Orussus abietinus]XP_023288188.1 UPF0160 protein MYG1, mitochondrial isoform X2 [Orussus abietinus]